MSRRDKLQTFFFGPAFTRPGLNSVDAQHQTPALSVAAPMSMSDCKWMFTACDDFPGRPGPTSNTTVRPTLGLSALSQLRMCAIYLRPLAAKIYPNPRVGLNSTIVPIISVLFHSRQVSGR